MTKEEKIIVPQIILNDLKYLSVRKLYFDWFFPSGAEIAIQLLDNTIKLFLRSVGRDDLVTQIRGWGGDESHNIVRMIEMLKEEELIQDCPGAEHKDVLHNLHKAYQLRYLDSLSRVGEMKTLLSDLNTIDYMYSYFRGCISIGPDARNETLINKVLSGVDLPWGKDKIKLASILYENNMYFKP